MAFLTDIREFVDGGLGVAREVADLNMHVQQEAAIIAEGLGGIDAGNGEYHLSDLERERIYAAAYAEAEENQNPFGVPTEALLIGAVILAVLVTS